MKGIWDTGASASVITTNVAQSLGLVLTGMTNVNASGLSSLRSTYTVDMELPNGVIITGLTVTDTTQLTGGIDALIGMDVISMGDFSITNFQGRTCMSFRIPSLIEIDYANNKELHGTVVPKKETIKPAIGNPLSNKYTKGKGKKK